MKNSTKNKFVIYTFTPNDILVNASGITSVFRGRSEINRKWR